MADKQASTSTYETIATSQIPRSRRGKHHSFVAQIFSDLLILPKGRALKIPLLEFRKQKMENARAALNRAGKKVGLKIATSSDDYFFYVWIDNKDEHPD
jgi:hypothetical protein